MPVAAKLYAETDSDRRDAARLSARLDSTLRDPAATPIDIIINDISPTGFRASTTADLADGANVRLGLPGVGMVDARVVRRAAGEYGCMFATAISPEQIRTALSADSVVWGTFPMLPASPDAASLEAEKYPPLVSLLVIACAASACWAGVIGLTMALFR